MLCILQEERNPVNVTPFPIRRTYKSFSVVFPPTAKECQWEHS
jgi:hypothetical protein